MGIMEKSAEEAKIVAVKIRMVFSVAGGLVSWLLNSVFLEATRIRLEAARMIMGMPQYSSVIVQPVYVPNVSTYGSALRSRFVKSSSPAISRKVAPRMDRLNFLLFRVFEAERRPKTDAASSKMIMAVAT